MLPYKEEKVQKEEIIRQSPFILQRTCSVLSYTIVYLTILILLIFFTVYILVLSLVIIINQDWNEFRRLPTQRHNIYTHSKKTRVIRFPPQTPRPRPMDSTPLPLVAELRTWSAHTLAYNNTILIGESIYFKLLCALPQFRIRAALAFLPANELLQAARIIHCLVSKYITL